ncbi:MAG TPA: hypothetical protein VGN65_03605 [Casimicrobiaceae bacterium]|jgi:hypothetical protein
MARSILERTGERAPRLDKGHTTRDLGPSDRSDTGSDITGGPGLENDSDALDLQHGTTSDAERSRRPKTAGPDIGDENLDSDSDSAGTGERASAGRDAPPPTDESLSVVDDLTGASNLISADDLGAELSDADEASAETPEARPTSKRARARRTVKSTRKRR